MPDQLPGHLPAVFWTTCQSVTLRCEAVAGEANEISEMPKKNIRVELWLIRESGVQHDVILRVQVR